jgi:hypothetical protein
LGNSVDKLLGCRIVDIEPFCGFGFLDLTVDEIFAGG